MQRLLEYYQQTSPVELNKVIAAIGSTDLIGIEALAERYGMLDTARAICEARLLQLEKTKIWLGLSRELD